MVRVCEKGTYWHWKHCYMIQLRRIWKKTALFSFFVSFLINLTRSSVHEGWRHTKRQYRGHHVSHSTSVTGSIPPGLSSTETGSQFVFRLPVLCFQVKGLKRQVSAASQEKKKKTDGGFWRTHWHFHTNKLERKRQIIVLMWRWISLCSYSSCELQFTVSGFYWSPFTAVKLSLNLQSTKVNFISENYDKIFTDDLFFSKKTTTLKRKSAMKCLSVNKI